MTTEEIAEKYQINQEKFEDFVFESGLCFASGWGVMSIEDKNVSNYVYMYKLKYGLKLY